MCDKEIKRKIYRILQRGTFTSEAHIGDVDDGVCCCCCSEAGETVRDSWWWWWWWWLCCWSPPSPLPPSDTASKWAHMLLIPLLCSDPRPETIREDHPGSLSPLLPPTPSLLFGCGGGCWWGCKCECIANWLSWVGLWSCVGCCT